MLVIVALAAITCTALWRNRPSKPDFKTTDEMMTWLSKQAVEMAEKNSGVQLDYTPESIKTLDNVLGNIHDEYQRTKATNGIIGLAMAYGAYIGEVIRRSEPDAKWEQGDSIGGEKSYPIHWRGGNSYVCAWCYRRILDGDSDNVWFKYQALKNWKNTNSLNPQISILTN